MIVSNRRDQQVFARLIRRPNLERGRVLATSSTWSMSAVSRDSGFRARYTTAASRALRRMSRTLVADEGLRMSRRRDRLPKSHAARRVVSDRLIETEKTKASLRGPRLRRAILWRRLCFARLPEFQTPISQQENMATPSSAPRRFRRKRW